MSSVTRNGHEFQEFHEAYIMNLGNNLRPRRINYYLKIEHTGSAFGGKRYSIKWEYHDVQKPHQNGNERERNILEERGR